jgi:membrane-associated protease RseP (regulator of RpoE activity)
VVTESVGALGKVFSPSGIGAYVDNVTGATSDAPASGSTTIRPLDTGAPAASSASVEPADENRLLSILGVIRLGSQAADSGWIAFFWLLVMVNIFLGLFNLLPLPPLDGGHAAVATYEAIREKVSGRPYRVDISKLMPITYAMVFLIVAIGVTSLYLDIVDPVQNPFGP